MGPGACMMRPMDMNWCADNTGRNAMIKVLSLLTRKDGISHEQFVRHWYDIHGPLALAVPGIRRYVQSHITDSLTRPDIPETDVAVEVSPNFGTTTWKASGAPPPRRK